jgi:hypothetical protein
VIVCDRTWKRDGQPVAAAFTIEISGPEMEEEYHLSLTEVELVRSFLNEPTLWVKKTPGGKVRQILSLKDKEKPSVKASS